VTSRLGSIIALSAVALACSTTEEGDTGLSGGVGGSLGEQTSGGQSNTDGDGDDDDDDDDDDDAVGTTSDTGDDDDDSGGFPDDGGDSTTGEPEPPPFEPGHVFVVGFNDRMVFEYDAALQPVSSWSHPSFDVTEGPSGMVFDENGYLVVAAFDQFCVFTGPNEVGECHPKIQAQRTENVIFDIFSNLYTTTSTGGTDEIHKYDADYNHVTTFTLPTGNLTGVTCDPEGDLFIASQTPGASTIYKVASTDLAVLDSFTVPGNAEGLQYADDGNLLVALSDGVGIARVVPSSPSMVIDTTSNTGLLWPVPLTIDAQGNMYTGDFENGTGSVASDLFVFGPMGNVVASREPSELMGPFGMVVAGVSLPCGALPPPA